METTTTVTEVTACQGMSPLLVIVWLALALLMLVSFWKIFAKAGKPGWGCLIPIYNCYLLIKIAGKPGWWLILFFIPLANIVAAILVALGVARNFGKGGGFAAGIIFLPIVFYPILAFGDATYNFPEAVQEAAPPPPPPAE